MKLESKKRAITSYGVILHTVDNNNNVLYQMCQRRDTISYDQFLKNHIKDDEMEYYAKYMSVDEKKRCLEYEMSPKLLWQDLWINHNCKQYQIYSSEIIKTNIEKYHNLLENFTNCLQENPWGFSHGRKHISENELQCALREFEEETTISKKDIQILNMPPYEEFYIGLDKKLYKNVYFIAYIPYIPEIKLHHCPDSIRKTFISSEVNDIKWCTYKSTLDNLPMTSTKDLISKINYSIIKYKHRLRPNQFNIWLNKRNLNTIDCQELVIT